MKKILIVCTGNTCRSSMAEGLLKKMLQDQGINDIEVSSAGTSVLGSSGANENAIAVLESRGIDLSTHRSTQVTKEMIEKADLILTMTVRHRENLIQLCPGAADKTFTLKEYAGPGNNGNDLDIADPFGLSKEHYEHCANEIYRYLEKVVEKIKKDWDEWKSK